MRVALAVLALVALLVSAPSAMAVRVDTASSRYGTILVSGKGLTLYAFTRDGRGPSRCFGDCARAWPPFLTKRPPRAVGRAKQRLVGSVKRGSGRQVTYRGRPLYFYVGEDAPGEILCQDVFEFGGDWLIVRPNGALVR